MADDPKSVVEAALRKALAKEAPQHAGLAITLERPRQEGHGDFSSSVALQLAKALNRKPRDLAQSLIDAMGPLDVTETPEIAGPGFINFRLKAGAKLGIVERILREGRDFGRSKAAQPQSIQVEFVSANPTGPLHVGHGRQAAIGDALSAILEARGDKVTREFYYNDAGAQIEKLAASVQARAKGLKPGDAGWPAEGYAGEYIEDIAREIADKDDLEAIRQHAVACLRREQDVDLQAFGVKFDVYYLESSLYAEGKVEEVVRLWSSQNRVYEKDGALWLRTTDYGDDKDRVVRKSDGTYTYFVPDVAYHLTKCTW